MGSLLHDHADNEQELRRESSMVAQDNDATHGDVNSRQVAYQEDDNLKLQNENIQEYKELHEQTHAYFSSTLEILDQKFKQELASMAKDAHRKPHCYIANSHSIVDISEEKLQISQRFGISHANTLHVTDDQFESFHCGLSFTLLGEPVESQNSSRPCSNGTNVPAAQFVRPSMIPF